MPNNDQFLQGVSEIVEEIDAEYQHDVTIDNKRFIPTSDDAPLGSGAWWKIDEVVCVYVDMKDSTKLSAEAEPEVAARAYQYFIEAAVRILHHFGASYIDVRGDGAFGLFDRNRIYHALCAAITFKTIVGHEMKDAVAVDSLTINCHIGIDVEDVLVKRIGIKRVEGKSDKQNEVWAGKPVNMAAKLASKGGANELVISARVYEIFEEDDSDMVMKTCGCSRDGTVGHVTIWSRVDVKDQPMFDFENAYVMNNMWCETHGRAFCIGIMKLDQ